MLLEVGMLTSDLIDVLASELQPVGRRVGPLLRTATWLTITVSAYVLLATALSLRDTVQALAYSASRIDIVAGLIAASVAAYCAFSTCIPGRPKWLFWLSILSVMAWLLVTVMLSIGELAPSVTNPMAFLPGLKCIMLLGSFAFLPAVLLITMLRRAIPLANVQCAIVAGIAITSISVSFLRAMLFHPVTLAPEMLTEHFGAIALAGVAAALLARRLLPASRLFPAQGTII